MSNPNERNDFRNIWFYSFSFMSESELGPGLLFHWFRLWKRQIWLEF